MEKTPSCSGKKRQHSAVGKNPCLLSNSEFVAERQAYEKNCVFSDSRFFHAADFPRRFFPFRIVVGGEFFMCGRAPLADAFPPLIYRKRSEKNTETAIFHSEHPRRYTHINIGVESVALDASANGRTVGWLTKAEANEFFIFLWPSAAPFVEGIKLKKELKNGKLRRITKLEDVCETSVKILWRRLHPNLNENWKHLETINQFLGSESQ